jgi:hypothetical protein
VVTTQVTILAVVAVTIAPVNRAAPAGIGASIGCNGNRTGPRVGAAGVKQDSLSGVLRGLERAIEEEHPAKGAAANQSLRITVTPL